MKDLPVIQVDRAAFGPCGITLGQVDAGGGNGQQGLIIPIVTVDWLDERETCAHVQSYIHGAPDAPPDYPACGQYSGGECLRMPGRPCAFHEALTAKIWRNARCWLPHKDGLLFVGDRSEEEIAELVASLAEAEPPAMPPARGPW